MPIPQLITELQTIAQAQLGLNSFIYGDPFDVNNYRDKQYPLLLIDRNVNIEGLHLHTKQRIYTFKIFFYDRHDRHSQTLVPSEEKQHQLEHLAEQFLAEFRRRYREQAYPWALENDNNITGFWAYYKQNDRLVQLHYTLKIRAQGECPAGQFDY